MNIGAVKTILDIALGKYSTAYKEAMQIMSTDHWEATIEERLILMYQAIIQDNNGY